MRPAKSSLAVVFTAFLALSLSANAAKLVPVTGFENNATPATDKPFTAAEVRKAIMKSAIQRGWTVAQDTPGKLRLELVDKSKGEYHLTVDVTYTAKSFGFAYVKSDGLKYDEGAKLIHSSFARWMKFLIEDTNKDLTFSRI